MMVVFALPYSIMLTSIAIIVMVVAWLMQPNLKHSLSKLKSSRWVITGTVLIYIMTALSLIYTKDKSVGLFELEKGIALLLFPILFTASDRLSNEAIYKILWAFIIANLSLGLISIAHASYCFFYKNVNIFFYHDLVEIFDSHATYYSLYLIFSLVALFYLYSKKQVPWSPRLLVGGITFFFTIVICLLGARSTVFIFLLASLISIVIYAIKSRSIVLGIGLTTGFFLVVFFVINNNSNLKQRLIQLKDYKYELSQNHIEGYNGLTTRLAQWEASMSIVAEAPIFGVGVGDVQDNLQEVYKKNFLKYSYMEKFNAHNEYVQTLLGLGFVGLIIFLFALAFPFYQAYKKKAIVYLCFIALFAYCCITESTLHVQKGIVFYSFFNSLFLSQMMKEAKDE